MGVMPRMDDRVFREPLTVTCPICKAQKIIPARKRNDHRWPGEHCDGPAGSRHPLRLMTGPERRSYA